MRSRKQYYRAETKAQRWHHNNEEDAGKWWRSLTLSQKMDIIDKDINTVTSDDILRYYKQNK